MCNATPLYIKTRYWWCNTNVIQSFWFQEIENFQEFLKRHWDTVEHWLSKRWLSKTPTNLRSKNLNMYVYCTICINILTFCTISVQLTMHHHIFIFLIVFNHLTHYPLYPRYLTRGRHNKHKCTDLHCFHMTTLGC